MACALPEKAINYESTDSADVDDMGQTSQANANDTGSDITSARLEEIYRDTDSLSSDEGNVELPPKVGDFSSSGSASSETYTMTDLPYHVRDLDSIDPSTEKVKELSIKIVKLQVELEMLQAQLDKSHLMPKPRKKVTSKKPKISNRFQIQKSEIENKQLNDSLEEMRVRVKALESQLQKSEIENSQLKDELASMDTMSMRANDRLESQLQKSEIENNQLKAKVTSMDAMSMRVKDLESQKAALDDKVKQLSENYKKFYTNMIRTGIKYHTYFTSMRHANEELRRKLSSGDADRCLLQAKLDEAHENIQRLQNESQSSVNEAQARQNVGEPSEIAVECEGAKKIEVRNGYVDIYEAGKFKVPQPLLHHL